MSANVSNIAASDTTLVDNQQVTITVTAEDDDGTLTISTNESDDTLTFNSCSGAGACGAGIVSGSGTSTVTINTNSTTIDPDSTMDTLTVTLTLRAECGTGSELIVITASQPGDTDSYSVSCSVDDDDTNITIHKDADFSNASFRFVYSVSNGTCAAFKGGSQVGAGSSDDFNLSDNQSVSLDCTNNAVVTVTEDIDASLVSVSCGGETGVSVSSRSVQINTALTDASVSCVFHNQVTTSNVAAIQLSASNVTPTCGTAITISAYVFNTNGSVAANGTVVNFTATPGTLSSTTASTVNGVASVVYTAPANYANVVNITAFTGSASAVGQLRTVCAVVAAPQPPAPTPRPAAPAPAAPAPTQPVARPSQVVAPPSAGDGGLLGGGGGGFGWTLFAGILLAAGVSIGGSLILYREPAKKD